MLFAVSHAQCIGKKYTQAFLKDSTEVDDTTDLRRLFQCLIVSKRKEEKNDRHELVHAKELSKYKVSSIM